KKFGAERVIDTPLAESGVIATSIGMAVYGLKPVAEIQFNEFLFMGYHQLKTHGSRMRTKSRGRYSCPMVVRTPYGGGIRPLELHSESMDGIFAHTPGIKVVVASNPYDAKGLLISAIRDPDPVIFLEPTRLYRSVKDEVPEELYTVPIGKAKVVREGKDLTIISWGGMLKQCLDASDIIKDNGVNAEILDVRTISPLDSETIINSVKKTGRVVIVHEDARICGLGAEIIAQMNENILTDLVAPPVRVTGFDVPFPLYKLEDFYMPNVDRILAGVKKVMEY
ncbi:MAG: alpha-ketoacid dehydrogenase subunit beta, partial [Nanoarchaeota archaeon]